MIPERISGLEIADYAGINAEYCNRRKYGRQKLCIRQQRIVMRLWSIKRCGRSGLKLPRIALGLWQNFGLEKTITDQEEILCHAFDHGITHFDLANNYGHPSNGLAEKNFGQALKDCLGTYRG